MAKKSEQVSTREFSKLTGIPVSSIANLLRQGKIKGVKKAGKWMISKNQLHAKVVQEIAKIQKPPPAKIVSAKTQSVTKSAEKITGKAKDEQIQIERAPARTAEPSSPKRAAAQKTYSVSEFSAMTYLTDFGVTDWLKKGRLQGIQDENGDWRVDSSNLERPNIKRLLRE
jgi:predicted site-specific integrase-resolvase